MEPSEARNQAPSPESVEHGYETTDVRTRGLWLFLLGGAILMIGLFAIVAAVLDRALDNMRMADRPRSSVVVSQTPPAPQIQPISAHDVLPYQDLEEMHRQEDGVFQKLGWKVDPNTHAVVMADDIVDQVRKTEAKIASGARTQPTVGPQNANTINPGPPTLQTTGGTALSPQGPGGSRPARREP